MKRALQRVEATFATLIPRRHSNFCYSTSTKLQADELSKPTKHRTDFITTNWRNESTRFLTTSQANGIWETFCTLEMPNKTFKFDLYTNVGKDLQNIKISEIATSKVMTRFYLNKEECALLFDKLTKMRDDLKNRVELESTVGEYKQKIVRTETINTEHQIFYLTVYEDSNGGTLFISRHLYEQQGQRPLIKSIGVPLTGLEMFYKALSNILERIGQTTTIKESRTRKTEPGRSFFKIGKENCDYSMANRYVFWHDNRRTESEIIWPVTY